MKFNSKNKKSFYFGWKEIAFIAQNDKKSNIKIYERKREKQNEKQKLYWIKVLIYGNRVQVRLNSI